MWLTHMSNTCVGDMCRTHTAIELYGYTAIELTATELTAIDKDKDKGRFQESARAAKTLESFLDQYKKATGQEHAGISQKEKESILERLERIYANFAEVTNAKPKLAMQITMKQFFDCLLYTSRCV